jgi:flap endonuclease-1
MGIKHLYQLIEEHSPASVKKGEIKNQFGRKVAIVSLEDPGIRTLSLT